jgi:hypothetical protein
MVRYKVHPSLGVKMHSIWIEWTKGLHVAVSDSMIDVQAGDGGEKSRRDDMEETVMGLVATHPQDIPRLLCIRMTEGIDWMDPIPHIYQPSTYLVKTPR